MSTVHAPRQLAVAAVALCCAAVATAGGAEFFALGDLPDGDFHSNVMGISGDGSTIVGWSKANDNANGQYRAYRWREDIGMAPLGHIGPETANSTAVAASFDGSVIVGTVSDSFRWTEAAGMQTIGSCIALGISGDGETVVGYCQTDLGNEAATWTLSDGWTTFGALGTQLIDAFFFDANHDGTIRSGQSIFDDFAVEPTRWTPADGMVALGDVPGGVHYGLGLAISADGSTIVGDAIGDVGQDAFLWTEATGLVNLEAAERGAVTDSHAHDVSGNGAIIVGSSDLNGAMIWDAGHGMRSVQQMLIDLYGLQLPGWTLLSVEAISDNGRVLAGNAINPAGDREAWCVRLPPFCAAGDVDDNSTVNIFDLTALLQTWGPCADCPADFTDAFGGPPDGVVDVFDLLALLTNWGACPLP